MVGPPAPGAGGGAPPGIPPGMPPAPAPAAPYIFVMMGVQMASTSFCLCSYSSFSAVWLLSSHLMASEQASSMALRSSAEIFVHYDYMDSALQSFVQKESFITVCRLQFRVFMCWMAAGLKQKRHQCLEDCLCEVVSNRLAVSLQGPIEPFMYLFAWKFYSVKPSLKCKRM